MNATLNAVDTVSALVSDPIADRAMFFFDLEMIELRKTIPQAAPLLDPPVVF